MGCSSSRSNKANEIAIKPKVESSQKVPPKESNPRPETGQKEVEAPKVTHQSSDLNKKKEEPPKTEEKQKTLKLEKPAENHGQEEGFGIIRTVSSKPGHVYQEPKPAPKAPENLVNDFLSSIYSSVKTQVL